MCKISRYLKVPKMLITAIYGHNGQIIFWTPQKAIGNIGPRFCKVYSLWENFGKSEVIQILHVGAKRLWGNMMKIIHCLDRPRRKSRPNWSACSTTPATTTHRTPKTKWCLLHHKVRSIKVILRDPFKVPRHQQQQPMWPPRRTKCSRWAKNFRRSRRLGDGNPFGVRWEVSSRFGFRHPVQRIW